MNNCGKLGLLMIDAPVEYGGLELDKATSMLAAEKLALSGSFSVTYSAHTGIGTLPLVYYGTKEQKEKYLGKIISGEWIAAYCLTEPGSGSDALGATATASLSADGKHYILNGTKQFITNGGQDRQAAFHLLPGRTEYRRAERRAGREQDGGQGDVHHPDRPGGRQGAG